MCQNIYSVSEVKYGPHRSRGCYGDYSLVTLTRRRFCYLSGPGKREQQLKDCWCPSTELRSPYICHPCLQLQERAWGQACMQTAAWALPPAHNEENFPCLGNVRGSETTGREGAMYDSRFLWAAKTPRCLTGLYVDICHIWHRAYRNEVSFSGCFH